MNQVTDATEAVSSLGAQDTSPGLTPQRGHRPRQLVLLGTGQAHVHVLSELVAHPLHSVQVTLVAPQGQLIYANMLPGFVAGQYSLKDCTIPVENMVRRGGIRWLAQGVKRLDAQARSIVLEDGTEIDFDWLSISIGPVQNRENIEHEMPGARAHGLFLRPLSSFAALWPRVQQMGQERALRVTVIGADAIGIEMACAVRERLPNAAVTLVTGPGGFAEQLGADLRERLRDCLRKSRITVLHDAALGFDGKQVRLGCGAGLACDVPLIASGASTPPWLQDSGLSLDEQGLIAVDRYLCCKGNPYIFAVGEVTSQSVTAQSGASLLNNLRAAVAGNPLQAGKSAAQELRLINCGPGQAIASWGNKNLQGHFAWWLKSWMDRRFVARYSKVS